MSMLMSSAIHADSSNVHTCRYIKKTTTLGQFQSGLKTMLFRLAYGTRLGAFVTV